MGRGGKRRGLLDKIAMCWLGIDERRVDMLSGPLMGGLGKPKPRASGKDYDALMDLTEPQVSEWRFDVFEFMKDPLIGGKPLAPVTLTVLRAHGLLDGWRLDRSVTIAYLEAVEEAYLANAYHNNIHAADVVQAVHCMLNMDLSEHLTDLEKFCLIIAAAVHDVAHPGLTNDFHIRCRDDVAFWYNDTSCNENLHARLAFEIASSSPRCDVFKSLGPELYPVVRRTLIQAILATDMQQHFLLLELFEREIENSGPNLSDWSDKVLVLKMALHLADLSNPARPVHLAQRWGHQVVAEMFRQGDVERSLGMPVSPVCDKDKVKVATAQMRFISYFLSPTVDAWGRVCPTFAGLASSMAARALDAWREYDRTVAQAQEKGAADGKLREDATE